VNGVRDFGSMFDCGLCNVEWGYGYGGWNCSTVQCEWGFGRVLFSLCANANGFRARSGSVRITYMLYIYICYIYIYITYICNIYMLYIYIYIYITYICYIYNIYI
jgi:hypothetical protein